MKTINKNMGRRVMFVPTHLTRTDLQHVLGSELPLKTIKNVQVFLHTIIVRNTYLNSKDNERNAGFVQISKKERRSILGKAYLKLTDLLISKGIIEVAMLDVADKVTGNVIQVQAYGKGHSSKKYRISEYTQFKRNDVTEDAYIVKKLDKLRCKGTEAHEIYLTLQRNTDLLKLKDSQLLRESLTEYYRNRKIILSGDEYISFFNSLETPITVDTFGNRFHAKHTRLKKEFRAHLEFEGYEGQELFNVDIVNSQPLLLSIITPELIQLLAEECSEAVSILNKYRDKKDYKKFAKLCQKGIVYEYFIKGFKKHFNLCISRGTAKTVFYYACYSSYPENPDTITSNAIEAIAKLNGTQPGWEITKKQMKHLALLFTRIHFPSLFSFNQELKKLNWKHIALKEGKRYKQHANSPLLAQRIESALLLKNCALKMKREGVLFTTIHDSFVVLEKDAPLVRRIIQTTFEQLQLPKPRLKVEHFTKVTLRDSVAA